MLINFKKGLDTHLFVKVPYLDQKTAKESLRSSSQAATCYYQFNHSKVRSNPVKCFQAKVSKF